MVKVDLNNRGLVTILRQISRDEAFIAWLMDSRIAQWQINEKLRGEELLVGTGKASSLSKLVDILKEFRNNTTNKQEIAAEVEFV